MIFFLVLPNPIELTWWNTCSIRSCCHKSAIKHFFLKAQGSGVLLRKAGAFLLVLTVIRRPTRVGNSRIGGGWEEGLTGQRRAELVGIEWADWA